MCNVKDTYTNTLLKSFFAFRFVISHKAIKSTFTTNSVSESCPVCHSVAMWFHIQYYNLTYDYRSQHSRQIQLVNPVLFVIQQQCDFTFNIKISHMTIEVNIHDRFSW